MEFEEKWLEICSRAIDSFEKMVELELKREERFSKPIEPVSITPISKFATPDTIKEWYKKLEEVFDYMASMDDTRSSHIKNIITEIALEMKKYVDEI